MDEMWFPIIGGLGFGVLCGAVYVLVNDRTGRFLITLFMLFPIMWVTAITVTTTDLRSSLQFALVMVLTEFSIRLFAGSLLPPKKLEGWVRWLIKSASTIILLAWVLHLGRVGYESILPLVDHAQGTMPIAGLFFATYIGAYIAGLVEETPWEMGVTFSVCAVWILVRLWDSGLLVSMKRGRDVG